MSPIVPRLPGNQWRGPQRQTGPKRATEATQFHKCHACHAECTSMSPSAMPATRRKGRCCQVPRLRRRMHVDVAKCHACHARKQWRRPRRQTGPKRAIGAHACRAECTSMSPSATPAMQRVGRCRLVPRLPRKVKVDVIKCHACQANSRDDHGAKRGPARHRSRHKCHACHKVKVDVAKCHACHANGRGDNGVNWDPSAPPEPVQCHKCLAK